MERAEDEEDSIPNQPIHGGGAVLVFSRRKMVSVWEQSVVA